MSPPGRRSGSWTIIRESCPPATDTMPASRASGVASGPSSLGYPIAGSAAGPTGNAAGPGTASRSWSYPSSPFAAATGWPHGSAAPSMLPPFLAGSALPKLPGPPGRGRGRGRRRRRPHRVFHQDEGLICIVSDGGGSVAIGMLMPVRAPRCGGICAGGSRGHRCQNRRDRGHVPSRSSGRSGRADRALSTSSDPAGIGARSGDCPRSGQGEGALSTWSAKETSGFAMPAPQLGASNGGKQIRPMAGRCRCAQTALRSFRRPITQRYRLHGDRRGSVSAR